VPALLYGASRRLQKVSAASTTVADSSARVAETQPPKRRASIPTCSVPAGQLAVPRSVQQVRANNLISACNGRETISDDSRRQTSAAVFNNNSTTQSAVDDLGGHSADVLSIQLSGLERRLRPPTVGVRSLIPRPVSCSGHCTASPRHKKRDPQKTSNRNEPSLRRFDSGVDVAAAGLSPSDDGVGEASLEAVVQRLSASLESCTLALLADNYGTSPVWQNESNTVDNVNDIDDEYY